MRYGILGATGPSGLEILKRLKGEAVSVYVRNPGKLPAEHGAEVVQGQLSDKAKLKAWASQQDVVLVALGHGLSFQQIGSNIGMGSYSGQNMMADVVRVLIDAKPKRIVHLSAYGTRETRGDLPFFFGRVLLPILIAKSYADHEVVEALLEKSSVEWVVARPGMLTNGAALGVYRAQERFEAGKTVSISRADVADFMVKASAGNTYLRKFVGLGY